METVNKQTCLMLSALLSAYGIRRAVVSPGTRCAPVVTALYRSGNFRLTTVIDERSAAFMALGMAAATGEPVAIVCTSGSAMLNYAPALAEAYYRHIPLIAVTADRPARWIDQLDGQTIRQAGALYSVVRRSVDIPVEDGTHGQLAHINRLINDTLHAATGRHGGPVHINIQLDAPLVEIVEAAVPRQACRIPFFEPEANISPEEMEHICGHIAPQTPVMVILGGMHPSEALKDTFRKLESHGVLVLAETQANVDAPSIASFEKSLDRLPCPSIVVSAGDSLVSARMKDWLRTLPASTRFICVGYFDNIVDTFSQCAVRAHCHAETFFPALLRLLADRKCDSTFRDEWIPESSAPDTDTTLQMIQHLLSHASEWNVHFGNGMAIRYGQKAALRTSGTVDCNRGVNGIDGSTSTAIGAAMVSPRTTLLVTGDMSAAYDIGALAADGIPACFKMAVLNNGGGDIFRRITTTRSLPERERFFAFPPRLPLRQLAEAYGFAYFNTDSPDGKAIDEFAAESERPAILDLTISPYDNGKQ